MWRFSTPGLVTNNITCVLSIQLLCCVLLLTFVFIFRGRSSSGLVSATTECYDSFPLQHCGLLYKNRSSPKTDSLKENQSSGRPIFIQYPPDLHLSWCPPSFSLYLPNKHECGLTWTEKSSTHPIQTLHSLSVLFACASFFAFPFLRLSWNNTVLLYCTGSSKRN